MVTKMVIAVFAALLALGCGAPETTATGPDEATGAAVATEAPTTEEPTEEATADPADYSNACGARMNETTFPGEMQDTVEAFYPAVRACETPEGWAAAAEKYGAIDGDPIEFLRNVCLAPELEGEPLCEAAG